MRLALSRVTRSGTTIGRWRLTHRLGGGGNGEIWAVVDGFDNRARMRLVPEEAADRLGRFRDETRVLVRRPDTDGVLPIIDSGSSGQPPRELLWHVTPVATPIRAALGDDPDPVTVLRWVAEMAETLESLHRQDVHHRYIHPDSLFVFNGRAVVGDFGLAAYPEKDPRTRHGRKLAPIDYMAPELRESADLAAPGPADVYALAKTLWVLLTGQNVPCPGPFVTADPAVSLASRLSVERVEELDALLEAATRSDPDRRLTVEQFGRRLRACQQPVPTAPARATKPKRKPRTPSVTLEEVQVEAAPQPEPSVRTPRADRCFERLSIVHIETLHDLHRRLGNFVVGPASGPSQEAIELLQPAAGSFRVYSRSGSLRNAGTKRAEIYLAVAMSVATEDGPARALALAQVWHWREGISFPTTVIAGDYEFPMESAQEAVVFQTIRAQYEACYPAIMSRVSQILAREPS